MIEYKTCVLIFCLLNIVPVEIKSHIQDNKNKKAQNNNKTSGAVLLRSMVLNGKWSEKFVYLGKEGAEKNIWSNMCSRILEEQNK